MQNSDKCFLGLSLANRSLKQGIVYAPRKQQ